MKPQLRELIPAVIVVVFLASAVALVFELLIAAASGRSADSAATTVLGIVLSACVPALVTLYLRDSTPPKPPEVDDDGRLVQESREVLRKYLDEMTGGRKWKQRSA